MNAMVRSRGWIAVAAWAVTAGTPSAGTYLAVDGPPPLRFARPGRVPAEKTVLPALAMTSADTGSTNEVAATSEPSVDPGASEPLGPMPPDPTGASSPGRIVIPPAALTPAPMIPGVSVTPQVLLNYFGPAGTNVMGPVVLAPVSFIPPQPGVSGSSRATYRQVP